MCKFESKVYFCMIYLLQSNQSSEKIMQNLTRQQFIVIVMANSPPQSFAFDYKYCCVSRLLLSEVLALKS